MYQRRSDPACSLLMTDARIGPSLGDFRSTVVESLVIPALPIRGRLLVSDEGLGGAVPPARKQCGKVALGRKMAVVLHRTWVAMPSKKTLAEARGTIEFA